MPNYIVVRIVPQTPVDAETFANDYLAPLGGLTITAYQLDFSTAGSQPPGPSIGSVTFNPIAPAGFWASDGNTPPNYVSSAPPPYPNGTTTGLIQQVDAFGETVGFVTVTVYRLQSVATAVIEVNSVEPLENVQLAVKWASQTTPTATNYYDLTLASGAAPDLSAWAPAPASGQTDSDPWASQLTANAYISLGPAPSVANPLTLQLPTNGAPPSFDALLAAVKAVLTKDPGALPLVAAVAAGAAQLTVPAGTTGITPGMTVTGAGVAPGTIVTSFSGTTVTLSQELSGALSGPVNFAANLAGLSFAQCQNIAYEILWSQQPTLPTPPDPLEDLFTNPPNDGSILGSGSSANQKEGDRQQFEAALKTYYTTANANADRLTNYIYALSAAIACEQMSLAATEALILFPAQPDASGTPSTTDQSVILTAIDTLPAPAFGVPAAYFYALGSFTPTSRGAVQRYDDATGTELPQLLSILTAAVSAQSITDAESFVMAGGGPINAAQAARRLCSLGVPKGSTTALAPLGAVAFPAVKTTASGTTLNFASIGELSTGLAVSGPGIAPGTTINALAGDAVTLSQPLLNQVPTGTTIVFTPTYSAAWKAMIADWLAFPANTSGNVSSQVYQPSDDDAQFWPSEAAAQPSAFLELVLCALTDGYVIPPPIGVALGEKILAYLVTITSPPTVATLAQVTQAQWTTLFTPNPTWLPPQPGGIGAQINAFIETLRAVFPVGAGGPQSVINLVTSQTTTSGGNQLTFLDATALAAGSWSVASALTTVQSGKTVPVIPLGTNVASVGPGTPPTTIALSATVLAAVPAGTAITFRPTITGASTVALPSFPAPTSDWIAKCLAAYQPGFTFGGGIANPANLATAAANVFPNDPAAQAWLFEAIATIDALCALVATATGQSVTSSASAAAPLPGALGFSIVEALYARGFRAAADITALSQAEFAQALIGSPAFASAGSLYTAATAIAPPATPTAGLPGFHPVNPDGSLTNCIPPRSLSPLGPVAYLHDLLGVAENATCEQPEPATPGQSLGQAIAARRGPLANLAASAANLETRLPLIDLVNECLEAMVAASSPAGGVVYDTSADALAGFAICPDEHCRPPAPQEKPCFEADALFAALPEHATPANPTAANAGVEPAAYDKLKSDFSASCLPYDQALDVSRTILRRLGSCRFEAMRTFRRCITEFVFHPAVDPFGFDDQVWRYPVRLDIAIEYLGISPEEYTLLFQGTSLPYCAQQDDRDRSAKSQPTAAEALRALKIAVPADAVEGGSILRLDNFLALVGLDYCEFYALWSSGIVGFGSRPTQPGSDDAAREGNPDKFPPCEPCCLDQFTLAFPRSEDSETGLLQLIVVVRLWRKLKADGCCGYTFDQLRDIAQVLQLFTGGSVNPEFIRQFAAFQMLRDDFHLPLCDRVPAAGVTGVARSPLLALWVTPRPPQFAWAARQLVLGVARHAKRHFEIAHRDAEFFDRLASELDPLSVLAGFDPSVTTDTWCAAPNHTLRFAEILAKLVASPFRLAEVRYLLTADPLPEARSPFPLQDEHEALVHPLALPEDRHDHDHEEEHRHDLTLLKLRHRLLEACVDEESLEHWHWHRVAGHLHNELGFAETDILALGAHFVPHALERSGIQLMPADIRFQSALASASTSPATWTTPPDNPFQYDPGAQMLWTRVPLRDKPVLGTLGGTHVFSAAEQTAIQDLYFQPRALLARFGLLFPDFPAAVGALVEEESDERRWRYLRHAVALCLRRRHIIADHLARHVAHATGQPLPHGEHDAHLILSRLLGDENALAPTSANPTPSWENADGTHPATYWTAPTGGALAALLGLAGTGLVAEYAPAGGGPIWRDTCGTLDGFGRMRDRENCPVPTVLPALNATVPAGQADYVTTRNGLLFATPGDAPLGGAQGFAVSWTGALLVDEEGHYEFLSGAVRRHDDDADATPDFDGEPGAAWLVTLARGSRNWVIASRGWSGEPDRRFAGLTLRPGAYDITVKLTQPGPDFGNAAEVKPRHTGLALVYEGPDTEGARIPIPHRRLMQVLKDKPLGDGITGLAEGPSAYLSTLYVSSLRDIRRTYQRAFKALLFAHRFALSAAERPDEPSELAYMLDHAGRFAGTGFTRSSGAYVAALADFDFNYLPVLDDYHLPAGDQRAHPSPARIWALFDIWERVRDYTLLRAATHRHGHHVWRLFATAAETLPADPGYLLREIGAPPSHWPLDLRYFQAQDLAPYQVTAADLEDERWTIRAWRADRWLDAMRRAFTDADVSAARPDLWVADSPAAVAGTDTGNANLLAFLCQGEFHPDAPRRMEAVRKLVDGLRHRARDALVAYLCANDRTPLPFAPGRFATVPSDLSAVLLLDVESGLAERASRIDEAVTAVQTFVRRARLGLEPSWTVSPGFARFWDGQFANFEAWRTCRAQHLYKENWLEWTERGKARRSEAFRLLENHLEAGALGIAAPGGDAWWPQAPLPDHAGLPLTEVREPVDPAVLTAPREGIGLMASPERSDQPAWLAALPPPPQGNVSGSGTGAAVADGAATPMWMQAAVRLGINFVRVAAACVPQAANRFAPHPSQNDCVTCCSDCGCEHEPGVDEYYFWLIADRYFDSAPLPKGVAPTESNDGYEFGFQDDYYDANQQQSAYWQDQTQLPQLLAWDSLPMVRLAWCRVHNGQFFQPRRSLFGVAVQPDAAADLRFSGRTEDSLFFTVSNGVAPLGYADPEAPGFRYDLARDMAAPLPLLAPSPPVSPSVSPLVGGLPAYPWFAYAAPGVPPTPVSAFSPSLAIGRWLREHCRFEAALAWARHACDPLQSDNAWVRCQAAGVTQQPDQPATRQPSPPTPKAIVLPPAANPYAACCDAADVRCDKAEQRAILLFYLETLMEWGHALMRRRRSPEATQQARAIFDAARWVLGTTPIVVYMPEPATPGTVGGFVPAAAPLNPRLMDLYDRVVDQLALIHHAETASRLPDAALRGHGAYFGDSPLREGWRRAGDCGAEEDSWCHPPSPYRFSYLIQKALEYASRAQELGNELLSAFEKGDTEYLAALRAVHDRELTALGLDARRDQWRDADWQIESLQKTKAVSQANLTYYTGLINTNLIDNELQYQNLTNAAIGTRGDATAAEAIGEGLRLIPDFVVGGAGFGGSPVAISWLPLGTKLGDMFAAAARILNDVAQIQAETAGLDLTEAGWQRRYAEWVHQQQVLTIEIQQIERQILGAQRRRDQMLHDLNVQQRQIEHAAEVDALMRDKFTSQDLYLFLRHELSALYARTFDLALDAARQAERAFNLERGHTTRHFVGDCLWDNLREGLTAGERLSTALRRMEKTYADENVREYELTKQISLRLEFPLAYLLLRTTGRCEIELPESLFDRNNPGHYMRRLRAMSLTLPCVAGPYTGVHCRLTLIDSITRIDPRVDAPPHGCCCPEPGCACGRHCEPGGYRLCADDPRAVRLFGEREAIATSGGQNDAGLFELNFNDPRYLPFEYMGAVSRWRIELPPENNYFDPNTLSDVVMQLHYIAREGGEVLREAARRAARCKLPGDGWAFFDVRHDFPDAWELLRREQRDQDGEDQRERRLALRLGRQFFPFLPHDPRIRVTGLMLWIETRVDRDDCPDYRGCPCPDHEHPGWFRVCLTRPKTEDEGTRWPESFVCDADPEKPGLFVGSVAIETRAVGHGVEGLELIFVLPAEMGEIVQTYLFCRYEPIELCCSDPAIGARKKETQKRSSGPGRAV